ncbi:MAG TPA: hypothetical protein VK141_05745 [Nitrosomonas sp.]|nr:hypothetical protein [Nitrosomonas sp.]
MIAKLKINLFLSHQTKKPMKKNIDIGPTGHSPCVEPIPPTPIRPEDLLQDNEAKHNKSSVEELPYPENRDDNPSNSDEGTNPPTEQVR